MIFKNPLCAVVAARSVGGFRKQLALALRQTTTIELRIDWLSDDRAISRFLKWLASARPRAVLIATCRRREAGGRYRGSISKQLFHLAEAVRAGCAWYDLEIETAAKCPAALLNVLLGDGKQLKSAHFFRGLPQSPKKMASALMRGEPDAIKIAAHCDSLSKSLKLLRLAREVRKAVVIPMGDVAMPVRLLSVREGSALSYAPVEHATAPGQISLEEAKHLYRVDRIDRRTRLYGVIGDPIGHSLSPVMQNAGFQARRMNAVYIPFLVHDLEDFLRSVEPLRIRGFSITLPYKETILRYLSGCDPLARKIQAVNTVVVLGRGKFYGYNTDYVGVLRALESQIPLRDSRVLLLGAGGAARAVAFALAQAGAGICISARRMARAQSLAHDVGGETIRRQHLHGEFFDAIVNATPVGMFPHTNESPLDERDLNCRLVFDTIYRPRSTKLLQLAARRGIKIVSGVDMFVAQGTAQWEIWTGDRAPVQSMRGAVTRALDREEKSRTAR